MNIDLNKVYNEDCLEFMKKLPDNSIDLVITDPPYGDGIGYGRNKKEILNNEDESINYKFLDIIYSKMKNNTNIYIFSNHKFCFNIKEYALSIGFSYRMMCILVKNNFGLGHGFRNQYEICLVLEKGTPKYNLGNFSNVWKMKHIVHDSNSHPHEKDINILIKILKHSSKEGDIVFDGFLGSFSTIAACIRENRKFVGCELDSDYYNRGLIRMNEELNKSNNRYF